MPDIMQTSIKSLPLVYRGKVRECYAVGEDKLLMIATDRISAFDVILSAPIPKKGKVLTALTNFWFDKLAEGMPIDVLIARLQGIRCGMRPTSCPDQLARALIKAKQNG